MNVSVPSVQGACHPLVLLLTGLTIGLSIPLPLAAQSRKATGMVQRIDARSSVPAQVLLSRRGEDERPLALGQYVYDGDRIRVPNSDASVVVTRPKGALTICPPGSASGQCNVVLDSSGGLLEGVVDFSNSLLKLITWYSSATPINVTTRSGDPPEILIGAGRPQSIQAGNRTLWLEWANGRAPFVVHVRQGQQELRTARTEVPEIAVADIILKSGSAEIAVVDADGKVAKLPLAIVEALPALANVSRATPDEISAKYVYAAWLAAQKDGAFLYESALELSAISRTFPAAEALRRALSAGERLRP